MGKAAVEYVNTPRIPPRDSEIVDSLITLGAVTMSQKACSLIRYRGSTRFLRCVAYRILPLSKETGRRPRSTCELRAGPLEIGENDRPAICLFGDYDPCHPRQAVIKRGLEKNNARVFECNCVLQHYRGTAINNTLVYVPNAYARLLRRFCPMRNQFSVLIVAHGNHSIVPLAWVLGKVFNKKVIMDAYDPAYHTALMKGKSKLSVKMRYFLEKTALSLSDYVLVATDGFKELYLETYPLKPEKVFVLPVGANEEKFRICGDKEKQNEKFKILYWGNFHPHHGVEIVVNAAKLLKDHSDIEFVLAGAGPGRGKIAQLVHEYNLPNVSLPGFLPDVELANSVNQADVCLGIFSSHRLALCSETNKVLEAMAMGKAIITLRNPVTASWFKDREEIYLVPPEDPEALAQAILELKNDEELRNRMGNEAARLFRERFSEKVIGRQLLEFLAAIQKQGLSEV